MPARSRSSRGPPPTARLTTQSSPAPARTTPATSLACVGVSSGAGGGAGLARRDRAGERRAGEPRGRAGRAVGRRNSNMLYGIGGDYMGNQEGGGGRRPGVGGSRG